MQRACVFEALEARILCSVAADAELALPGAEWGNSELMVGRVAVNVVLLESNGQVDTQTQNWTANEIQQVKTSIDDGLTWWQDAFKQAMPNTKSTLSFQVDWTDADQPVSTSYEPIRRRHQDESLWVSSFLQSKANELFEPSPTNNYLDNMKQYNDATRQANGTDWALTVFVVDSSADRDGKFADGYYAYAHQGGPFVVMTYDNGDWGVDGSGGDIGLEEAGQSIGAGAVQEAEAIGENNSKAGLVFAHELGHVFYALDEYEGSDDYTATSGYFNAQNTNAFDRHPNPQLRVDSLYSDKQSQLRAYENYLLSPSTMAMIGWVDADRDGILDVENKLSAERLPVESANTQDTKTSQITDAQWVGQWTVGSDKVISAIDLDGTHVTFKLKGQGTGQVYINDDGLFSIQLSNTNKRTKLIVRADQAGDGQVALGDILADQSVHSLTLKQGVLWGQINVQGSIQSIQLASSTQDSQILATSLGILKILGNSNADLTLAGDATTRMTLKKAFIGGDLQDADWQLAGGSVGNLVVGGNLVDGRISVISESAWVKKSWNKLIVKQQIIGSTIASSIPLKTLKTAGLMRSTIAIGAILKENQLPQTIDVLVPGDTPGNPQSQALWGIGLLKIHSPSKKISALLADSIIVTPAIKKLIIDQVATDNQGKPFGIATKAVGRYYRPGQQLAVTPEATLLDLQDDYQLRLLP